MSAQIQHDTFQFEIGSFFCANTSCELHVRPGDPGVRGQGNWVELRGLWVGRRLVAGRMICDFCAPIATTPPG
jgi:hypothetical protein